jgi:fumarate hydratase class II
MSESKEETNDTPPMYRSEHDLIGDEYVPVAAYYGIQTQRAMKNFDITGVPIAHFPQLIRALAMVKKAAALANHDLGHLNKEKKDAICQACDEIIDGSLHSQFPVDLIQGGAGTSTNMNANEVGLKDERSNTNASTHTQPSFFSCRSLRTVALSSWARRREITNSSIPTTM